MPAANLMMNFERRLCPRLLKLKGVAIFAKTPGLILPPEIEGARVAGHNKLCRINQSAEMTGGEGEKKKISFTTGKNERIVRAAVGCTVRRFKRIGDKSPQAFRSEAWWEGEMNTVHFPSLFSSRLKHSN